MNIVEKNISINSDTPILFSHVIDEPEQSQHSFHLHDYIEIYIYVSGDVNFIIRENYVSLKKGDIIITQENVLHKPIINSRKNTKDFI